MSSDDGVPQLIEELSIHLAGPGPGAIRAEASRRRRARRVMGAGVLTSLLAIGVGAWAVNGGGGSTNDVASGNDAQTAPPVGADSAPIEFNNSVLTNLEQLESQGLWRVLTMQDVSGVADVSFDGDVFALTNGCTTRSFHIEPTADGFTTKGFAGIELLGETYLGTACDLILMTGNGLEVRRNQEVTIDFDASSNSYTLTHADDDGWPWRITLSERKVPAQQRHVAAVAALRENGGQLEFRRADPAAPFDISPHNAGQAFLRFLPGTDDDAPQLIFSNGCEAVGFDIIWAESGFRVGDEIGLPPNAGRVDAARCQNPGEQRTLATTIRADKFVNILVAGDGYWFASANADWAIFAGPPGATTDPLQVGEAPTLPIPDLSGLDLGLALDALDQLGILAGELRGSGNARCPVQATDPPASTLVEPGSQVNLILTDCTSPPTSGVPEDSMSDVMLLASPSDVFVAESLAELAVVFARRCWWSVADITEAAFDNGVSIDLRDIESLLHAVGCEGGLLIRTNGEVVVAELSPEARARVEALLPSLPFQVDVES